MSTTLLFAAPALRGLVALFDIIAEDNPARAARSIMRIHARCERLEIFPHSAARTSQIWERFALYPVWPAAVFYRVDGDFVIVARVIDGRLDLGTI